MMGITGYSGLVKVHRPTSPYAYHISIAVMGNGKD